MATISEINQEQSYRGDANLSGYGAPILIDVKPLDDLARFTMIKSKFMYEEDEKKQQGIAKQIADLSAYDLTVIPEESKIVQGEWGKLIDMVRKDPTVMDFNKNPQGYIDYYQAKNRFSNKLQGGKSRLVIYAARQSEIEKETNIKEKERKQRRLDEDVKKTGIDIPLPSTQQFEVKPIDVKATDAISFDVVKEGANMVANRKYSIPNYGAAGSQANAIGLGLMKESATPEQIAKMTPLERDQYDARVNSERLEPVLSANELNDAIAQLKTNPDGTKDFSKAPDLLKSQIEQFDRYNSGAKLIYDDIKTGKFQDKLGTITFGKDRNLNESDFAPINYQDGVTPEELIKMRIIAKTPPPSYVTTTQQTDNAIQYDKLAQDEAQSKRQYNLGLEQIKASKAAKGKTTQELLSEMGNALDSFTNYGSAVGSVNEFRVDNATGKWVGKDGKPYTSPKEGTRIAGSNVPDKIKNLIKQANPDYNFSDAATLIISDGEVKSIQYDNSNPVDRNNIQNYQVNEVSKFTEKGNPFIPYYGAGEQSVSRPAPKTTTTESKESTSKTNRLSRKVVVPGL